MSSPTDHPCPPPELQAELRAFLRRHTACTHLADDLAQESLARALSVATRAEVQHWRGLLYRIARNLLADGGRRRLDTVPLDELALDARAAVAPGAGPEALLEQRWRLRRVAAAIDALPPRCREALERVRLDGQTHAQAAQAMGISVNAVEKHMIRAMRALAVIE